MDNLVRLPDFIGIDQTKAEHLRRLERVATLEELEEEVERYERALRDAVQPQEKDLELEDEETSRSHLDYREAVRRVNAAINNGGTSLDFSDLKNLKELPDLSGLDRLRSFDVSNTNLTDISRISSLTALENFVANNTPLRIVASLALIETLDQVQMKGTPIKGPSADEFQEAVVNVYDLFSKLSKNQPLIFTVQMARQCFDMAKNCRRAGAPGLSLEMANFAVSAYSQASAIFQTEYWEEEALRAEAAAALRLSANLWGASGRIPEAIQALEQSSIERVGAQFQGVPVRSVREKLDLAWVSENLSLIANLSLLLPDVDKAEKCAHQSLEYFKLLAGRENSASSAHRVQASVVAIECMLLASSDLPDVLRKLSEVVNYSGRIEMGTAAIVDAALVRLNELSARVAILQGNYDSALNRAVRAEKCANALRGGSFLIDKAMVYSTQAKCLLADRRHFAAAKRAVFALRCLNKIEMNSSGFVMRCQVQTQMALAICLLSNPSIEYIDAQVVLREELGHRVGTAANNAIRQKTISAAIELGRQSAEKWQNLESVFRSRLASEWLEMRINYCDLLIANGRYAEGVVVATEVDSEFEKNVDGIATLDRCVQARAQTNIADCLLRTGDHAKSRSASALAAKSWEVIVGEEPGEFEGDLAKVRLIEVKSLCGVVEYSSAFTKMELLLGFLQPHFAREPSAFRRLVYQALPIYYEICEKMGILPKHNLVSPISGVLEKKRKENFDRD